MKENDVEFIGTLLGLEADAVNSAIEDGTVGDKIKALNLMRGDQVETLKENLTKDVKQTYFGELVEKAKKGELDQELYKPIHGAVLEMTEKDLAKTYEVERGPLKDMVAKISNNGQSNDTEQLSQKIRDLQEVNERLVTEKEEAVTAAKTEYKGKIIMRDKAEQLNALPFDFSDVEEDKLETVSTSRKQILNDVFDARYQLDFSEDKLVVKASDGNIVKDPVTLEPLPVSGVMTNLASELGLKMKSPESGGQGGKSSGANGNTPFRSADEFAKYCDDNNLHIHSTEALKVWAERKPQ